MLGNKGTYRLRANEPAQTAIKEELTYSITRTRRPQTNACGLVAPFKAPPRPRRPGRNRSLAGGSRACDARSAGRCGCRTEWPVSGGYGSCPALGAPPPATSKVRSTSESRFCKAGTEQRQQSSQAGLDYTARRKGGPRFAFLFPEGTHQPKLDERIFPT